MAAAFPRSARTSACPRGSHLLTALVRNRETPQPLRVGAARGRCHRGCRILNASQCFSVSRGGRPPAVTKQCFQTVLHIVSANKDRIQPRSRRERNRQADPRSHTTRRPTLRPAIARGLPLSRAHLLFARHISARADFGATFNNYLLCRRGQSSTRPRPLRWAYATQSARGTITTLGTALFQSGKGRRCLPGIRHAG
jgi:hypothetical protein